MENTILMKWNKIPTQKYSNATLSNQNQEMINDQEMVDMFIIHVEIIQNVEVTHSSQD